MISSGPHRNRSALALVLTLLLLAGCAGGNHGVRPVDVLDYRVGAPVANPYDLPDQTLTDHSGRPYNLRTSPARPVVLLFFGYVHCPDVCRSVLADLATALQRLGPGVRDRVQVLFVSTDPARDTPTAIGSYLARFDPAFVGLSGDLATTKRIAGRVGVDIAGRKPLPSGGYDVGHSAQLIGFDARRRGVVEWAPGPAVADLKHDLALLVERAR